LPSRERQANGHKDRDVSSLRWHKDSINRVLQSAV